MITKFGLYNESIRDKIKGKSDVDLDKVTSRMSQLDLNNMLENASKAGNLDLVKYLHGRGADINFYFGIVLRWGVVYHNYQIVKYYLENGGNIDYNNDNCKDIFSVASHASHASHAEIEEKSRIFKILIKYADKIKQ